MVAVRFHAQNKMYFVTEPQWSCCRAAEAELALEQENDAKKFGTVKGATRKRLLLGQKQRSISVRTTHL